MTRELIFIGVMFFCIALTITDAILYIRRLRKTKLYYENLLKEIKKKPPKIIKETVPLSVIEARQYIPAEQYLRLPPEAVKRDMEKLLSVKIGEEIVKACGVQKGYYAETDTYCFRVAVEVTGRSLKNEKDVK